MGSSTGPLDALGPCDAEGRSGSTPQDVSSPATTPSPTAQNRVSAWARAHGEALRRVLLPYAGGYLEVGDLVQEVWVIALEKASSPPGGRKPG